MSVTPAVSRRGLPGAVGGVALAFGAGAGAGWAATRSRDAEAAAAVGTQVPFHWTHQAGVGTAVQDRRVCSRGSTGPSACSRRESMPVQSALDAVVLVRLILAGRGFAALMSLIGLMSHSCDALPLWRS